MIKKLSLFALLLLLICSCSTDLSDEWEATDCPLEFEFSLPDDAVQTKAKTKFDDNDKIYLTAKVACSVGEDKVVSTVLKYSGDKWIPDVERLMWPANAVKAEIVAYYLPKSGATASPAPTAESPVTLELASLSTVTDDVLMASRSVIHLNGVVMLQFAHTMTKLRVSGLDKNATTITLKADDYAIANQLVISYSETKGYTHAFVANGNDGVVMSKETATDITFFLHVEPTGWTGKAFYLTQKNSADAVLRNTGFSSMNLQNMKKGRAYSIGFYSGSAPNLKDEAWYAESPAEIKFETAADIKNYFDHLSGGLTEDLDFNNIFLDDGVVNFSLPLRSIGLTKDFNGNHHTIRNIYVRKGLFSAIPAGVTVQDLQLENVTVVADADDNIDCAGLLAPSNAGTITNVRISGNNTIGTENILYVGALVGKNQGTITEVKVSGTLAMDCYMESDESSQQFSVGGLVGYNEKGTISQCDIVAGSLLTLAGSIANSDLNGGGFVGWNNVAAKVTDCMAHVHVDASQIRSSRNSYLGGFSGINRGIISKSESSGDVKGGHFSNRAYLGGFVGYLTSGNETAEARKASANGCAATGDLFEADGSVGYELYTGGFCGFSGCDLKNVYSTGTITLQTSVDGGIERKTGALTGIISAERTIYNSFSITKEGNNPLPFNGEGTNKTQNSHCYGMMLSDEGVATATAANVILLNNAVSSANGYWEWSSGKSVYGGVPYLLKP